MRMITKGERGKIGRRTVFKLILRTHEGEWLFISPELSPTEHQNRTEVALSH